MTTSLGETWTNGLCFALPVAGGLFAWVMNRAVAAIEIDPNNPNCKFHESKMAQNRGTVDPNWKQSAEQDFEVSGQHKGKPTNNGGLTFDSGCRITAVEPASKAGEDKEIKAGFIITKVNGVAVSNDSQIRAQLQQIQYGGDATITCTGDRINSHMMEVFVLQRRIAENARQFLFTEYGWIAGFTIGFGALLLVLIGLSGAATYQNAWKNAAFTVIAFFIGAFASLLSGWIGMDIATFSNGRVALEAGWPKDTNDKYKRSFKAAFKGGLVMGFALTSVGMICLAATLMVFRYMLNGHCVEGSKAFSEGLLGMKTFDLCVQKEYIRLFECVAAFGLGGSAMAAFGRVGGGIFTKAADVGSDLCGKVVAGLPEDDKRNPGVIADCVGDNVGDIAGMGSDLFGSFGEASCAALVVSAYGTGLDWSGFMFPVLVTGAGMVACFVTALFVIFGITEVTSREEVEPVLKKQLTISTVLTTLVMYGLSQIALPETFNVAKLVTATAGSKGADVGAYETVEVASWEAFLCIAMGLWAGLLIGYMTEMYTSNRYSHVRGMASACATGGAATNIIAGLAVGYNSCIVPCFAMAVTVYVSFNLCLMYGIALAALGVLSTMSIGLAIDAYGPIADNAGGIVEMAEMESSIRTVTDDLDAAGNTTAAIGKGFAISSAAFVALALYGAFVTHCDIPSVNIIDSRTFPGLLVGAMLPYWFSGMTMTSVNKAAMEMVKEIKRQFEDPTVPANVQVALADGRKVTFDNKGRHTMGELLIQGDIDADFQKCVDVSTASSLREMVPAAGLVMISPLICGIFFGKEALAGLLPGATISGVEMAISMSNTGGAWDNTKKYIEGGQMVVDRKGRPVADVIAEKKLGTVFDRTEGEIHCVRKKKAWSSMKEGSRSLDDPTTGDIPQWRRELQTMARQENLTWGNYTSAEAQSTEGTRSYGRLIDIDHEIHSSAVIGDTVGDPLKDTSGPALNILVKLMAIISVVIVPVVNSSFGGYVFNHLFKDFTQCASVAGKGCQD